MGGDVAEGGQEGGCGVLVVCVGELGADTAVVGQVQVDLMVFADPVGRPVAGGLQGGDVDDDLQRVHVRRPPRATEVIPAMDMHAVDRGDPTTDVRGKGQRVVV